MHKYTEVKLFAKKYKKELIPMLKKMGFNAAVRTKNTYYSMDGTIVVVINKVPSNFDVWEGGSGYADGKTYSSSYHQTDRATKLLKTIEIRIDDLLLKADLEPRLDLSYDMKLRSEN